MRIFLNFVLWCALLASSAVAQTITPYTFGNQYSYYDIHGNPSQIYDSIIRLADGASSTAFIGYHWNEIETARGVYNWADVDTIVTQANGNGQDIIFAILDTPNWANSSAGPAVPPTSMQDYYDFVTTLVTRYKGKIKYYEPWNEVNNVTYWTGSQSLTLTLAQNAYRIIKSIDPTAKVMTPSVTFQNGINYLDSYLAAGGGAYADVICLHLYSIRWPGDTYGTTYNYPEQQWITLKNYAAAFAHNSNTLPIVVDEGGWLYVAQTPVGIQQQAFGAIWPILLASGGVDRMLWYAYDDNSLAGVLTTCADTLNTGPAACQLVPGGIAHKIARSWLTGATFATPVARIANANGIRNTTMAGASPGVPGTPPTNWIVYNPDSALGISTQVVGTGTETSINYLDWRVFGTAQGGASGFSELIMESLSQIVATLGQQWTVGVDVKLIAGGTGCTVAILTNETDAGGGYLTNDTNFQFVPLSAPLNYDLQMWQGTTSNASVGHVVPLIFITYAAGVPCDVTIRIGAPFIDNGTQWSGTITRPGGYQGQIIWDAAGGPTSYTPSGTYTSYRDVLSNRLPIPASGNVFLTHAPILLENKTWAGWTP